ncbi:accelerated cell death 11-like [Carex rostrata]
MIELDIEQDCVRQDGSHTRNLLRVLRGLNMFRVLYEEIIKSDGNSVRDAAEVAYEKVFAPHHSWGVRRAVESGKDTLPTKSQLLKSLNEDEGSAKVEMQSFVRIIGPVIQYVEELFNSMQLGIDW